MLSPPAPSLALSFPLQLPLFSRFSLLPLGVITGEAKHVQDMLHRASPNKASKDMLHRASLNKVCKDMLQGAGTCMADKSKTRVEGVWSMVWMSARVMALKGPILHIITACTSWCSQQVYRYPGMPPHERGGRERSRERKESRNNKSRARRRGEEERERRRGREEKRGEGTKGCEE